MAVRMIAAWIYANELEEEEEILTRRTLRDSVNPFAVSAEEFGKLFRLPQEGVIYLTEALRPRLAQPTRITGIPVHLRVLCALNFFACGGHQKSVGEDFLHAMSQSAVSRSIRMVSDAIAQHLLFTWVKFPTSPSEMQCVKERFLEKTGFPGVLGAIDATQIAIIKPHRAKQHIFLNKYGYYSRNVQIVSGNGFLRKYRVADYNLKIISINARHGGRTHDTHIWRTSQLSHHMQKNFQGEDQSSWLLGDSVYPLQPWLLTPFSNPSSDTPEYKFNASHSKAHSCVERCIGVWKSWFTCLRKENALRYTPERAGVIINVCAVLHNMALHYRVPLPEIIIEELDGGEQDDLNPLEEGLDIRSRVVAQHFL